MKEISEETFCHDFDAIMDKVINDKESFIITTNDESKVVLMPADFMDTSAGLSKSIQGELA